MNKILLIGRITFKPELVFTNGNIPYTKFGVAVKRDFKNANGEYETDFIPVQVWRRQAENVVNYLDKGSMYRRKNTNRNIYRQKRREKIFMDSSS